MKNYPFESAQDFIDNNSTRSFERNLSWANQEEDFGQQPRK